MVFNVTFNNISAISWRLVLSVEETGVPGENHRTVASHLLSVEIKRYYNMHTIYDLKDEIRCSRVMKRQNFFCVCNIIIYI